MIMETRKSTQDKPLKVTSTDQLSEFPDSPVFNRLISYKYPVNPWYILKEGRKWKSFTSLLNNSFHLSMYFPNQTSRIINYAEWTQSWCVFNMEACIGDWLCSWKIFNSVPVCIQGTQSKNPQIFLNRVDESKRLKIQWNKENNQIVSPWPA